MVVVKMRSLTPITGTAAVRVGATKVARAKMNAPRMVELLVHGGLYFGNN